MDIFNSIYLRRQNKIILSSSNGQLPAGHLATILKNIESLGYTLSPNAIEKVAGLSVTEASWFYSRLVADLKQAVGADVKHSPMYPNFPTQVMEMSEAELYLNAIVHYLGNALGQRLLPQYAVKPCPPLKDFIKLKIIELGTETELVDIFRDLLAAKTSISPSDRQDLAQLFKNAPDLAIKILPQKFSHKENLAYVASLLLHHCQGAEQLLIPYFKTATDVLRLAVAMSEGDISLAENTRFRNFSRPQRRLLLSLLEQCGAIAEDMLRYQKRWLRLGERLHPFEYKKRYPLCFEAFDILRNDKPFTTFNRSVERAFSQQQWQNASSLLSTRPGELARKLDFLIRNNQECSFILDRFAEVGERVSTPVLLQIIAHFEERNHKNELRVFFPKGNVAKAYAVENNLAEIERPICAKVVEICEQTLRDRFAKLPSLGKVYVDEQLADFPVPASQRSASKSLRQLTRGSRLPIAPGNTIRFFIWWKEGKVKGKHTGTVDLDLSAVMYDANWNYIEHISYTNLRSNKYKAAHSGDIVSAPKGASEFIDLDLTSIRKYGGRYIVPSVYSYSHHPFANLPECFGGWIMRQDAKSGKIYDPRTVDQKVDLTANTTITIPAIIDLYRREILWTDLNLTRKPSWTGGNNVENNQKGMVLIGKAMTEQKKPSLERLFTLHAQARGELVDRLELADTVFATEEGITPFDGEAISAKFLI